MRVGCHISISGGLDKAIVRAGERGCETMQVFLSAPLAWKGSDLVRDGLPEFGEACRKAGIEPIFVHAIYLINLASPNPDLRRRSLAALITGMRSVAEIGGRASLVAHLGSHLGEGQEAGIERVTEGLRQVLSLSPPRASLFLETSAGSGGSVGSSFPDLGRIIRELDDSRLGVCMDTCHVFAAGYDLASEAGIEVTLAEFDRVVGPSRLKVIHANDCKSERGSGVDRHEYLGQGKIGLEAFSYMAKHPALRELPWILETPEMTLDRDREQIRLLASLATGRAAPAARRPHGKPRK